VSPSLAPPPDQDPRIRSLRAVLRRHAPVLAEPHGSLLFSAAVALLVRPAAADLELLLILRAEAEGDPWSGHMALPGGKRTPDDEDELTTAIRETREEVGIDLVSAGTLLGRLDDVQPQSGAPRVCVSPFVFAVPPATAARPNSEVAAAYWVTLGTLASPESAIEHVHDPDGRALRFPAIGYRGRVIWGLTHRIVGQLLTLARDVRQEEE
jgi:8-oxo-dGTP pyrophosphatase MutT (NUDIX family)